ncbi:MAG: hypothetical protein WBY53_10050 [Acidobacteriaceae bacterium]
MFLRPTFSLALTPLVFWTASAPISNPLAPLQDETTKWSVLTYTQHYTDDQSEDVNYHGTLFVQLAKVSLANCNLTLTVLLQDRYTGTITVQQTLHMRTTDVGQKSQTSSYDYLLPLANLHQLAFTIATGRPMQIPSHSGFHCTEEPACKLTWLQLKIPSPQISETRQTDGFIDFNQMVDDITIPMSSTQAAQNSSAAIRELAEACRVPHP